jgi:hypothetical protein
MLLYFFPVKPSVDPRAAHDDHNSQHRYRRGMRQFFRVFSRSVDCKGDQTAGVHDPDSQPPECERCTQQHLNREQKIESTPSQSNHSRPPVNSDNSSSNDLLSGLPTKRKRPGTPPAAASAGRTACSCRRVLPPRENQNRRLPSSKSIIGATKLSAAGVSMLS